MRKVNAPLPVDPHDFEGYLIKELHYLLRVRIEARLRAAGIKLSFAHAEILHELMHEPGLSSAQLARRCGVTPQTMNTLVSTLEAQGVIDRDVHPENARVMRCFMRADGATTFGRGRQIADGVIERMLQPMTAAERATFKEMLRRCIAALEQLPVDGDGP